jgi:hypothetical protein
MTMSHDSAGERQKGEPSSRASASPDPHSDNGQSSPIVILFRWLLGLPNNLYLRIAKRELALGILLAAILSDPCYIMAVLGWVLTEVGPPVGEYQHPDLALTPSTDGPRPQTGSESQSKVVA